MNTAFFAPFLWTECGSDLRAQTKYPSVQTQNVMTATQTMEISGKALINKETTLKEELILEKFKEPSLPATEDRLLVIDKFGKVKAVGETTLQPGPTLPVKLFPYWRLDGNALGAGSALINPFIGSIDNSDVVFKSANTERIRMTAGGIVKITGPLNVSGLSTLASTTINGNATIAGNTGINGNASVAGNISTPGYIKSGNSIYIAGGTSGGNPDNIVYSSDGKIIFAGGTPSSINLNNIIVGIGTDEPAQKFEVNGRDNINTFGRFGNNSGYSDIGYNGAHSIINTSGDLFVNWYSGKNVEIGGGNNGLNTGNFSTRHSAFLATIDGNVGIGTNDPQSKLDVFGNIGINNNDLLLRNSHHGLGWYGDPDGNPDQDPPNKYFDGQNINGPVLYGFSGGALGSKYFSSSPQVEYEKIALKWTWDGKVGIGTTAPLKMLHVGNSGMVSGSPNIPTVGSIRLEGGGNSNNNYRNWDFEVGPLDATTSEYNTHRLRISNNGNEVATIDEYGNVGIGTTKPKAKLHIKDGSIKIDDLPSLNAQWWDGWRVALEAPLGYAWKTSNPSSASGKYLGYGITSFITSTGSREGWYWIMADENDEVRYPMQLTIENGNGKPTLSVQDVSWADYVFDENYKRPTFEEQEQFFKKHKHLHGIASEKEILEKGVDITGTMKGLTLNVEEMRLDMIDLHKMIQQQKKIIDGQQEEIKRLKGNQDK